MEASARKPPRRQRRSGARFVPTLSISSRMNGEAWLRALPDSQFKSWIAVLAWMQDNGTYGIAPAPPLATIAGYWGQATKTVVCAVRAAKEAGALIEHDGKWIIPGWLVPLPKPGSPVSDRRNALIEAARRAAGPVEDPAENESEAGHSENEPGHSENEPRLKLTPLRGTTGFEPRVEKEKQKAGTERATGTETGTGGDLGGAVRSIWPDASDAEVREVEAITRDGVTFGVAVETVRSGLVPF